MVAVQADSRSKPAAAKHRLLVLLLALAFVLGCRMLLYVWVPDPNSEFDLLYDAATRLLRDENPYPLAGQSFPYPLPAVLLAVPFTQLPLELARPLFDVLVGWVFVYALWRYRGSYALLALASGAYLFAIGNGQATPLMVAASLIPVLGFLLAVRPNTGASVWMARPSWVALIGVGLFFALSLAILPSWPRDWWMALRLDSRELLPPVLRPLGFVLLLGAIRWRLPEGRLIFGTALVPQSILPYELIPLALVPANRIEMALYVAGSWVAVAAAEWLHLRRGVAEGSTTGWLVTLCAVHLPMLYLVLRRKQRSSEPTEKERRRRYRLPDHELRVDVSSNGAGGVTVKVTHLPTQLSTTETGESRKPVERKAHDKLAAIVAERARRRSG